MRVEIVSFLKKVVKPLMNQRGAVGDGDPNAIQLDENGFIPGTSYKTVADLVKGHGELKGKFDAQGNELGTIRKDHDGLKSQTEMLANLLKENLSKAAVPAAAAAPQTEYAKEISDATAELQKLDPLDKEFSTKQSQLIRKIAELTAADTKEKTLGVASKLFKDELSNRDAKAAQQRFYDENPTFNTPEMQAKIKEYLSKDRTGMHDPMSAFFQIQRDDAIAQANQTATENAEMKKILELQKGKEATGKVVVKGQSPNQGATNPTKATGKDLDAGMAAALAKTREAGA